MVSQDYKDRCDGPSQYQARCITKNSAADSGSTRSGVIYCGIVPILYSGKTEAGGYTLEVYQDFYEIQYYGSTTVDVGYFSARAGEVLYTVAESVLV